MPAFIDRVSAQTTTSKRQARKSCANHLARQFDVQTPYEAWVTDITYIRTHEGWLYLAVILDLFFRQIVDWLMQSQMDKELVISALLMAIWKRKPNQSIMVDSDQGS